MDINAHFAQTTIEKLGPLQVVEGIGSSLAPFYKVGAQVFYPNSVVQALGQLFQEYNSVLRPPAGATEWDEDYRYCDPTAFAVQIDMAGLPKGLLDELACMPTDKVREALRGLIFEIDSSLAMYQLLERIFAYSGRNSAFGCQWRKLLGDLRKRHGKLALLAVTQDKYDNMMLTEFGLEPNAYPDQELIRELTGFDAFFGPEQFRSLVQANNGNCPYALVVRASDPVHKLRKPDAVVDHPLLGDATMRRIIRANTLVLNVDRPDGDPLLRVNDTKLYMPKMGLGYAISSWEELDSEEFLSFLETRGVDTTSWKEKVPLRAKPLAAAYGGYGHLSGLFIDKKFRNELRAALRKRGAYIIQTELPTPVVMDLMSRIHAGYIDRVFMAWFDGQPQLLGGFRNYMPVEANEFTAKARRIHGNGEAFWGEIRTAA